MGHNRFELNGRVAVVVGGTSGIGRTLALGNQCYRMFGAIWIRNYTFLTLGCTLQRTNVHADTKE